MRNTGGRWNRNDLPFYFIASNLNSLKTAEFVNNDMLIAVNEIGVGEISEIEKFCDDGKRVFIDSGIFNLTNEHCRNHDVSMDVALQLAPNEIDGFDELLKKYLEIVDRLGDKVWGYIELDQGGMHNKIKTREMLEGKGLSPIPVYHPLNDGWDYFDYLGENYDRICLGNVVQASRKDRLRIIATAWERKQKYPNLWIHVLGMTANEHFLAFPSNSCDSSAWLRSVRWATAMKESVSLKSFSGFNNGFFYDYDADPESARGHKKSRAVGAVNAHFLTKNLQTILTEYRDVVGVGDQCVNQD